jgi:hypothetical protein
MQHASNATPSKDAAVPTRLPVDELANGLASVLYRHAYGQLCRRLCVRPRFRTRSLPRSCWDPASNTRAPVVANVTANAHAMAITLVARGQDSARVAVDT